MQYYARINDLTRNTKILTYCNISFYVESKTDIHLLDYIPIDMLINMYCARGMNFNTENFKAGLRELGIENPMVIYKIVYAMTKMRNDSMSFDAFCKSNSSTCSKTSTLTKSSGTTDEPSLITVFMAVDQTRFDSEYIQYLGNYKLCILYCVV